MKNNIKNANTVVCKFIIALTRATNYSLEIVKEERQKIEKIIEWQKIKAIAAKRQKSRKKISFSS